MMEAICYSDTSIVTKCTLRHIPEDGILHSRRLENLKSYIVKVMFGLISVKIFRLTASVV
jgi:hypothetical protein